MGYFPAYTAETALRVPFYRFMQLLEIKWGVYEVDDKKRTGYARVDAAKYARDRARFLRDGIRKQRGQL